MSDHSRDLPHYTAYDTRIGAYAVIVDSSSGEDRILLALWNEGPVKLWTLPGGGVEMDESAEQGAAREVLEETGYEVRLGPVLGVHSHVMPAEQRNRATHKAMKAFRVFFEATITGGELTREVDGTTDEARWFPLAEVPDLPHVAIVDVALGLLGRS